MSARPLLTLTTLLAIAFCSLCSGRRTVSSPSGREKPGQFRRLDESGACDLKATIDPLVMYVNADKSTGRKDFMEYQLSTMGLPYQRVQAVSKEDVCQAYKAQFGADCNITLPTHDHAPGIVGTALSHLKAIHQAYKQKACRVVIVEDDVVLPFHIDYDALEVSLPDDWMIAQMFYLHSTTASTGPSDKYIKGEWQEFKNTGKLWMDWMLGNNHFGGHWGTQVYYINERGIKRIVEDMGLEDAQSVMQSKYMESWWGRPADGLIYNIAKTYVSRFPFALHVRPEVFQSMLHTTNDQSVLLASLVGWKQVLLEHRSLWPVAVCSVRRESCNRRFFDCQDYGIAQYVVNNRSARHNV